MSHQPFYFGAAISEILFCVTKLGFQPMVAETRARLFAECSTIQEFRVVLVVVELSRDKEEVNRDILDEAERLLNVKFPELDRMLRWPWHPEYEGERK